MFLLNFGTGLPIDTASHARRMDIWQRIFLWGEYFGQGHLNIIYFLCNLYCCVGL